MANNNIRAALMALLSFAIYATHDVIVKYLGAQYSPVQIVFLSVLLGFPFVTMMLIGDRSEGNLRPRHPGWTALRTLAIVVTAVSAFHAFSALPLAQTYAILFATPLLITLLSIPILGETVRLRRGLAVVVGLIGVIVVLRPGQTDLGLGHLSALAAAVGGALNGIIVRKIGNAERSVVLLLFPMLANFVIMGAILPFTYQPMPLVDFVAVGVIALLSFLAMLCMIIAYRTGVAVVVAPMQYSQILWAALFGYLFFDESPDLVTAVGAAIIIGSGLYILFREDNAASAGNQPVLKSHGRPDTGTQPRFMPLPRRRTPE
ncbi:DMT family transporter [Plastorhodobacter daqingensis]|uniref:DMT family transporter n=1 Tax=Plastorhodobacter daqingensis TaxID=1387281 RepID=A0ABW2UFL6_9RHOB